MGIEHVIYLAALKYRVHGGIKLLAEHMGRNYQVLVNKLNPHTATHHVYIDEIDELVAFLDTDEVAKYFAAKRNLFCVKSPGFDGISDAALLDLFLSLEVEKAQWMEKMKDALQDGNVTGAECEGIKREFSEFMSAAAEMMARIEFYAEASEARAADLRKRVSK